MSGPSVTAPSAEIQTLTSPPRRGAVVRGQRRGAHTPRLARAAMALLVCGMALLFAREMLLVWGAPDADLLDPFNDANTYRAAGERLNDGHQLYALQAGDRPVLLLDGFPVPLVSPPPVAAVWRLIDAVPFGFALWIAAAWVALLGTVVYLVMKIGLPAAVVAAALSFPIGEQLVAANMTAFFPALLVIAWRYRADPRAGAIIGVLAGLKLAPAVMGGWFVGVHRTAGLTWMLGGATAVAIIGAIGAGAMSYVDYAQVARSMPTMPMSLSGLSGIPWLSPVALVAGTVIAAALWRMPRLSFAVAVATLVIGSPVLLLTTFTLLLAALAPLIPEPDRADAAAPVAEWRSASRAAT